MVQITGLGKRKRKLIKVVFWLIAILLGTLQAWFNRFSLSSEDVISYLDIADAYLSGEWNLAINGNWSPLYSWLLGVNIYILKPSPYWELPVVKLTNFLIYLFALISFDFFLRELLLYYEKIFLGQNKYFRIPASTLEILGYSLFLWSSLNLTGVYCDTPDMCTAALVYLASGIVLRVHTRSKSWFNFIMLGVVLGFGYLSKAAMFPLAFVFLLVAMLSIGNIRQALTRVLVALLIFTIISAPFIVALSTVKGRLTYSDTGKLSYVWYVNPGSRVIPNNHWQGGPPGFGKPKHPTRKIFNNPPVFEFITPIGGTYPPWTDQSYWYDGLTIKFSLIKQISVLTKNAIFYCTHFLGTLAFVYLILVGVGKRFWLSLKALAENWRLLVPATAGLVVYILVTDFKVNTLPAQPSTRFIAPFIVLLFAGCFLSVRLPNSQKSKRLIAGLTIATLLIIGAQLSFQAAPRLVTVLRKPENIEWQVAESLHHLGIQPGEKVAVLKHNGYYWARLARVKIVADIPDVSSFWEKDAVVKSEVFKAIEKTGAKVIVQMPGLKIPDSISASGWKKLGNTDCYAYPLGNNLS